MPDTITTTTKKEAAGLFFPQEDYILHEIITIAGWALQEADSDTEIFVQEVY